MGPEAESYAGKGPVSLASAGLPLRCVAVRFHLEHCESAVKSQPVAFVGVPGLVEIEVPGTKKKSEV